MSFPQRYRLRPEVEGLETLELMSSGVKATLAQGVLAIVGRSAGDAIVVDLNATRTRAGIQGTVVVEDVASFNAARVRRIVIRAVDGEPVQVNRQGAWNPPVRVVPPPRSPLLPSRPVLAPVPTPVSPPVVSPPQTTSLGSLARAIVDAVNQQRALNGLSPLTVSGRLVKAAQVHADDMARLNQMAHDLPGAALPGLADRASFVGYRFSMLGENIAAGYTSASSVMAAWMSSSGHRANILGNRYTEIGIGIAYSAGGLPYYSQVFGSPLTA